MTSELGVGIIGMGSRGCSVLERIITLANRSESPIHIRVDIIDPVSSGQGLHEVDQPDYLLLNTLCGEISMFPEERSVGAGVAYDGPTLYEWVTERGWRLSADGHSVGREGRAIEPDDFLPRRVLGEYLQWFFALTCRRAPEDVTVRIHRAEAVDLEVLPDGRRRVTLSDGSRMVTDYVFLTVGHVVGGRDPQPPRQASRATPGQASPCASRPASPATPGPSSPSSPASPGPASAPVSRSVTEVYPLPASVADIGAAESVAISGFGLSAMDVMSALTVGRGGRFIREPGSVRYLPSGAEPRIVLFSRSGMPFRARPKRVELANRFQPVTLTGEVVSSLRAAGPLDFDQQIMPMLIDEMRVAYFRCRTLVARGAAQEERLAADCWEAARSGTLGAFLARLDRDHGLFDPWALWDPAPGMAQRDRAAYQRWVAAFVRSDLAEAELGVQASPVKAALETVREVRDTLRAAVNFRGLSPASLDSFMGRTVPLMNRAVVGPQKERHAELLALLEAGVVRVPLGAAPMVRPARGGSGGWSLSSTRLATGHEERVDWLCRGHAAWPGLTSSGHPLLRALRRRGALRAHAPGSPYVDAVDVDAGLHPVGRRGASDRRMWVIGPLCEGATFYNHLVPTPGYSPGHIDAHRCVTDMFEQFTDDRRAVGAARPSS